MKKVLLTLLVIIISSACTVEVIPTAPLEPVLEKSFDQVIDNGKIYTSKDFFDAGFEEYKEYNVSKLTGSTEAWYGYWGENMDDFQTVKYYELRFYPDHSTAVSDGTLFAEDATGEDANLGRKDAMWRVGLAERKISGNFHARSGNKKILEEKVSAKYGDFIIYNNVIILCEGKDSNEAFQLCNDLIDLVSKF